jgi:hypothetical protein
VQPGPVPLLLRTFILKSLVFGEKAGPCGPGGAGTMHDEHHHHTQKSVRGLEPVKKETTLACRESIQIQNCIEHLKFTTECVLQDMNITIGECHKGYGSFITPTRYGRSEWDVYNYYTTAFDGLSISYDYGTGSAPYKDV